ncbi:MAG: hypothetical protein IKX15_04305 [Spirochaetales bacterium]|nr:hypothetical protein [Spirochaetales bacterium]
MRGVGGGLVGGQQVDEEFYFAQASDVTVEADGGADVEAVEDVYFLVVDVPVVIFVEGLCEKAWLEVEGGGEGGIDVTEVVVNSVTNVVLERDGERISGTGTGNGPIDSAFTAIEQCIGHHYELDDFQIQAVTEGRESLGSTLVRLRSNGKLYSGNGISSDIVGASIRAYINALNKIAYEESQR